MALGGVVLMVGLEMIKVSMAPTNLLPMERSFGTKLRESLVFLETNRRGTISRIQRLSNQRWRLFWFTPRQVTFV